MYKVFFNDRIVWLCNLDQKTFFKGVDFVEVNSLFEVKNAWLNFLNNSAQSNLYLTGSSLEQLKNDFFQLFKIVEAAGGLVYNLNKELLCIYRWGKWDLPKGKIEKGEAIKDAAIREVEEETGISGVRIKAELPKTFHIYPSPKVKNEFVLKPTYWFRMDYNGNEELKPQLDEDITQAKWISSNNLLEVQQNTYASLLDLFENRNND